jgi:hypothetical protein
MTINEKYVDLALDTLANLCEEGTHEERREAAFTILNFHFNRWREETPEPVETAEAEDPDEPQA